ncbi:MAG: ArgK/MeaB family GTPase [Rubricella sp.]
MKPLPETLDALGAGGKAALARTLTALETRADDAALAALLDEAFEARHGAALGLTGPPGVGKSSLTQALIGAFRGQGMTVAILAVDPSSARTGGAILGDRTRIDTDPDDGGVYMRSMAARGALGGLSEIAFPAIVLMRALFDIVIVETVGVGQSEIEVAERTDGVVFCAQPGSGDALQFMKAGVMEIPDIVLVTKGDLGALATRAAADLRGALSLDARGEKVSIAVVSAATGAGIAEAVDLIRSRIVERAFTPEGLARRKRQGRGWLRGQIASSHGRRGLALIESQLTEEKPFSAKADRIRLLDEALADGWNARLAPPV